MKTSFCQMIAIVCILAVGFMTVAPFVQDANADGQAHSYIHGVQNIYSHIYCGTGHLYHGGGGWNGDRYTWG